MSSIPTILSTTFINRDGTKTYGVRIFDGYQDDYGDFWDNLPDDPVELLERVYMDGIGSDVICDNLLANKTSVMIDDQIYDWEWVKKVLVANDDEPEQEEADHWCNICEANQIKEEN
jgi:hypothetical protein